MNPADVVLRLGLTIGLAYAAARLARPLLRTRGQPASAGWWFAAHGMLLGPLLIPAGATSLRAVAAVACAELMFKMLDYRRECLAGRAGRSPDDARNYARFLIPFFPPFLVSWGLRERPRPRDPDWRRDLARLAVGTAMIAGGLSVLAVRSQFALPAQNFTVDHTIVFGAFILAIEGVSLALMGGERLAGFRTPPLIRGMLRSRTPAEFWMRYNTRIHHWLRNNLFLPAEGRRRPVWGTLVTFLYSALFHEVAFAIATSVFDGRQFAFFSLQIPAVLVSPALERLARTGGLLGKIAAHGLTILWFYVTSPLFLYGVARVFPFVYAHPL